MLLADSGHVRVNPKHPCGSRGPNLRHDAASDDLVVGTGPHQVTVRSDGGECWVARIEDVGAVPAASLQRVLRKVSGEYTNANFRFEVVEGQEPGFDLDYAVSDVSFSIATGRLVLEVFVLIDQWAGDEDQLLPHFQQLTRPLLERARSEISGVDVKEVTPQGEWACGVTIQSNCQMLWTGSAVRPQRARSLGSLAPSFLAASRR